ncbi:MAG: FHA domain-containing protein, partial [Phycisphaerales bacterium]
RPDQELPAVLVLHVLQGPDRGMRFELPADEPQLIGRSSEALPLKDTTVSRRHAELTPDGGRWFLRDLDSSNGTFVNGQPIDDRVELAAGDQIRCGSTLLVFTITPEEPKPSPISLLPQEAFDVSIESRVDASAESMILASPDPLRAAADHLRVVYDLTALTSGTYNREKLLEQVMDLIFEEFEPDRGFILLQEAPEDRPEPAVVRYKQKPKTVDEGRIPVSRTIVQHVLARRDGILSTNAMNDTRFQSGDSVREYGIRSAICVPVQASERVFGVIHIDSSLANFTFTDSQLQLLNAIGRHAGLAMLNAELVRSEMQTERLAAMGQAVASLSHSIKNILQGLRGGADAVELAVNRGNLDLAREGWPILSRNLDRIYALTLNMLAYSKQRALDIELNSLHALIGEVAELLQGQCDRKRVGLILDLADDVPPVPFDANALHQALMNLLANALEAVSPKVGVITIRTRYDAERHFTQIEVSDNGPGIPPQVEEQVFQAFRTTKGQRGTGLGLAVTKKIVEEHGGRIALSSQAGEGTTITITLPTDQPSVDSGETRLPRPMPSSELDEEF